jgi:hypothetical protein
MNFSVMAELFYFTIIALFLCISFMWWISSIKIKGLKHFLEKKEMEINHLEQNLKTKKVDFELYKYRSDLEKIQTAEDISKSLFVLNNKPKFEKGYNCDEFFVVYIEPKIIYGFDVKDLRELKWIEKDKTKNLVEAAIVFISNFRKYYSNDLTKLKIDQINKKAFEVYYSYTVFSKLDQKTMVVREEYLEAFRENHMKELNNNNQTKS